jgi:histidine triad (HIT) family protein
LSIGWGNVDLREEPLADRGRGVKAGYCVLADRARCDAVRFGDRSYMTDCIFCKIIRREAPGYIISESDRVVVFVSRHNDPLVVPKKHIKDIYDLDDETGSAVMSELIRIARAVRRGLRCEGVYITQANEPAAGQDVFHFHIHVYPRWKEARRNQVNLVEDNLRRATMESVKAALD